jgi:hypothetical protein
MPAPATWRGGPGICLNRGRLARSGLAVAWQAGLGPRPSSPAALRRCSPPVRHAHRLGRRHRRPDIADSRLDDAPRHWRRGRVLSLGHTCGSPTPAELLILGLSCVFMSLGGGCAQPRIRWSPADGQKMAARHAVCLFGGLCRAGHTSPQRLSSAMPSLSSPAATVSGHEVIVRRQGRLPAAMLQHVPT